GPKDVTVDGMAEPHFEPAAVRAADEQSLSLELIGHRGAAECHELGGAQRLTEGEDVEEVPLVDRDFPQPGLDQLREPGGRSQPSVESPDPEVVAQRPV